MSLNNSSATPLYMQLKKHIEEDIRNGKYKMEEQLPTEPELCDMYNVSRVTVRRAITELVKEGVLQRLWGKGTYVTGAKIPNELISVSGFSEFSVDLGRVPQSKTLIFETIQADEALAAKLQVSEYSRVVRLYRLLYLGDEPLFLDDAYYSLERFPELDKHIRDVPSTYAVLKERYNTEFESGEKMINIAFANKEEAELLNGTTGMTLYQIDKIAYDRLDKPIHTSRFICPAHRVTLTIGKDFMRKALH